MGEVFTRQLQYQIPVHFATGPSCHSNHNIPTKMPVENAERSMRDEEIAMLGEALSSCLNEAFASPPAEPLRAIAHKLHDEAQRRRQATMAATPRTTDTAPAHIASPGMDEEEGWTASKFVKSLGLEETIAAALCLPHVEAFEHCKRLTYADMLERLRDARLEGLAEPLWRGLQGLSSQAAATGRELSQKFAMEEGRTMALGGLDAFVKGLEALIGPALMAEGADGQRTLMQQMDNEHHEPCDGALEFESNNGVRTTSEVEWEFVFCPDTSKEYAERYDFEGPQKALRHTKPEWCRVPMTLESLRAKAEEPNARLEASGYARLVDEELVGGRLYTGPMFTKYNGVLRAHSKIPFFVSENERRCRGNSYGTTIHAINSCVLKLSKLQRVQKVYRGMASMALPDQFLRADKFTGVTGGVEFGFSSSTTERAQAEHYAEGRASTVFEMSMGMVRWHVSTAGVPLASPAPHPSRCVATDLTLGWIDPRVRRWTAARTSRGSRRYAPAAPAGTVPLPRGAEPLRPSDSRVSCLRLLTRALSTPTREKCSGRLCWASNAWAFASTAAGWSSRLGSLSIRWPRRSRWWRRGGSASCATSARS